MLRVSRIYTIMKLESRAVITIINEKKEKSDFFGGGGGGDGGYYPHYLDHNTSYSNRAAVPPIHPATVVPFTRSMRQVDNRCVKLVCMHRSPSRPSLKMWKSRTKPCRWASPRTTAASCSVSPSTLPNPPPPPR